MRGRMAGMTADHRPPTTMYAELLTTGRLRRVMEVKTDRESHTVEYDGYGNGYERVLVDGEVAVKRWDLLWFVPRFEFFIGHVPAAIDVRVALSFRIRAIQMSVREEVIYSEGE